ncbi:hypothetical protein [Roseiflexus castenholzii]|jgi:hypothetical protein|uniref:hypothetical protein n=1 Tax=Roseiflexus castenholzii TaxID=120962 RepID=UPI0000E7D82C|nr:hypothetical protein [Roseiflexus castenholzii]
MLLPVWATWLFFALLVEVGDAVAEERMRPVDQISREMVFRGLYHVTQAWRRGEAADPIKYVSAPDNRDLGVVKRLRKKHPPDPAFSTASVMTNGLYQFPVTIRHGHPEQREGSCANPLGFLAEFTLSEAKGSE